MAEYVSVEVKRLSKKAAGQHLNTPVVVKGRQIKSMTLTIPLLDPADRKGRRRYLIAKMPKNSLDELKENALRLPESQRNSFVRKWVRRNQRDLIEQYLVERDKKGAEKVKRFSYGMIPVPVPTKISSLRPARTRPLIARAPAQKAVAARGGLRVPIVPLRKPGAMAMKPATAGPRAERRPVITRGPRISQPRVSRPLALRSLGGRGTFAKPFVMEIPVPVSAGAGAVLFTNRGNPARFMPRRGRPFYYAFRFMGVQRTPASPVTSRAHFIESLSTRMAIAANAELRRRGAPARLNVRPENLRGTASMLLSAALRNERIRNYIV